MEEYTNFNNLIWKDTQLKSNEKLVLIYLISHHNAKLNYAYPTRKQIQEDTGISENTLNKILKNLETKGYIIKQKYKTKTGKNNIYYINKYLVLQENDNMTVSEAHTEDLTTKSTNCSSNENESLKIEKREPIELSTNEQLLKDNAKLNHALNNYQKEQVNQLDTDRLIEAIKQANKFANVKYSLNYILAIYKNNNTTEEPHRDTRGNVVRGAYQQKINTKPLTRYHNSFNEHFRNYSEDELEAKLLQMQSKRKI